VRVSIVRVLGSGPTSPPGGWRGDEATILGALQDPDEWVRAAAARVVGQQQIESGLLGLVKMTSDPAVEPRSQAAQALQHFPGVKPYLPELEAALARETNQVVRGSLSAAIALIRR
jgi:HEAT repeat protein